MTTTVGSNTPYPLTIPALSDTANIQTAIKLIAYGQEADPTNNADIETTSLIGYLKTGLDLKANIESPTFTGTVVLPSTTSIGSVSSTELSYLDGVTSSIQTQINDKANSLSPTFTGTVVLPSTTSIGNISSTELGYLDGVTSSIQTQIGNKANSSSPTFTGTVVLPSTTSIGNVSSTELSYLDGTTSSIQTQINSKANSSDLGYILITSGNITYSATPQTTTAYLTSGRDFSNYSKLIIILQSGVSNSGTGGFSLKFNAVNTGYAYSYNNYGATTISSTTGGSGFNVINGSTGFGTSKEVIIEIQNPGSNIYPKNANWQNSSGFGFGNATNVTAAITDIGYTTTTDRPAISWYIYGVK